MFFDSAWQAAGAGANSGVGVSASRGPATQPVLSANGGQMYLAWIDNEFPSAPGNGDTVYVKSWNGSAFVEQVPGDASFNGIVNGLGIAQAVSLSVDPAGHPYVSWTAVNSGSSQIDLLANTFNLGTIHYVNDGSTQGDIITTAVGNDANNGLSPNTPKLTLQGLFSDLAHPLHAGDVIFIDNGVYSGAVNLSGIPAGVLILGSPTGVSTLATAVTGTNASRITLENLAISGSVTLTGGGQMAFENDSFSGSGITLSGGTGFQLFDDAISTSYYSSTAAITIGGSVSGVTIDYNNIQSYLQDVDVTTGGATSLDFRNNQLESAGIGIALAAAASGTISGNNINAAAVILSVGIPSITTGISITAPFTGIIAANNIYDSTTGVSYQASAELSGNDIHDNVAGVVSTVASTATGFGFVGNGLPNQIFDNTTGVQLTGDMQDQHIFDNTTGVTGSGSLVATDLNHANLIEANAVGIDFNGPIEFNEITRENVGILAQSGQLIAYNLIYRNTQAGIVVNDQTRVSIVNNTMFAAVGDNVDITGGSSEIELLNNIFWAQAGYDINVSNNSQTGFYSDYNDLYATGTGKLVHWDIDFTDILDWQDDVGLYDLHSVGSTVVNPTLDQPRFAGLAVNDFQVIGIFAGVRNSSPTVNAGDSLTDEALPAVYQNLLTDPGFESGLTGWTALPSGSTQSANPAPWDGSSYFFAGPNAVVTLDQTVSLTASGYTAAQIDSDNLTLVFGGRVRSSANDTIPASGSISLTFYDANGNVISTITDNADNLTTRWELVGSRVTIPVEARTARFRFTAIRNSGTNNDSYLDGTFMYVLADSAALDLGAYGDVSVQSGATAGPVLRLITPDLYVNWLGNQPMAIHWESLGNSAGVPVRIDLYQDSPNGPQFLLNITPSTPDTGTYTWIAINSGVAYGTYGLRIEISLVGDPNVFDRGTEDFTVPENTNTFYVNGSTILSAQYTTAPGSNRNDGKIPSQPIPYPNNILNIYTLGPTQTLYVDAGTYPLLSPITVADIPGIGSDSAFTIAGPTDPGSVAAFSFANSLLDPPLITLDNADFMNIQDLTLQGGTYGILAENNSTNLTITNVSLDDNAVDGLLVENSPNLTLENVAADYNGQDGILVESGSNVLDMGNLTVVGNGGDGIYINGTINALHNSLITGNKQNGINLTNPGLVTVQANTVSNNGGDGILVNSNSTGPAIIGNQNLSLNLGNIVSNNGMGGIVVNSNCLVVGNVVSGSTSSNAAGIELNYAGSAFDNVVFGSNYGIYVFDSNSPVYANRVYDNVSAGILIGGASPVYDNVIYSNGVGLELGFGYNSEVNNNLIYANTNQAILVENGGAYPTQIVNNTLYQPQGDGIDLEDQSADVQLRNNIIWCQAGYDLSVATNSQVGFASDYNILYTTSYGLVGLWQGVPRLTLIAWRNADFTDENSLSLNPDFVNPVGADGYLGYYSATDDGRDDDFHEQSQQGSYHGGMLAPVISTTTGLPVILAPTLTVDANESPAIDRGAGSDSYTSEPAPNGGYINIGAYGDTAQASLSPTQYLLVTTPGSGGEVWPEQQTFNITWRFDLAPVNGSPPPAGTVDINLLQVGNSTPVLNIASAVPNNGQFTWTLPTSITPGGTYLVEITSDQYTGLTATSAQPFTITAPVSIYYINSSTVNVGGYTTAVGNDSNNGLTPATPKASIAGVLAAYHLTVGSIILVDAGTYTLNNTLVLGATASGIIIEGYNNPAYPNLSSIFNRGNSGSDAIDVSGATNLTLESLTITGGAVGIHALDSSGSTNLTVSNCIVYGNSSTGVTIGSADNGANVVNNVLYGQPDVGSSAAQPYGIITGGGNGIYVSGINVSGNTVYDSSSYGIYLSGYTESTTVANNRVYGNGYGIYAYTYSSGLSTQSTISNNTVFSNSTGIYAEGDVVASQNTVYGQTTLGINAVNPEEILSNIVYDNTEGIYGFGTNAFAIANNTVFGNAGDGIEAQYATSVTGNTIYGNATGVALDGSASAPVSNNLIYQNSLQGILTSGGDSPITNNTIYQPTGDAIDVRRGSSNVNISNNILWVMAGYDISVDSTSEKGFQSDDNDLYFTGTGAIGLWEGQSYTSLTSWILELNQDHHSISTNPQFVNPAGPNGVLGYSTTGTGSILPGGSPTLTGAWTKTTSNSSSWFNATATAGTGSSTATWTISGLTPGATYQISTAWQALTTRVTDAAFTVTGGGVPIYYQSIQQIAGNTVVSPLNSVEPIPSLSGTQDLVTATPSAPNAWPNSDMLQFGYSWPTATTNTASFLDLNSLLTPASLGVLQVPMLVTPEDKGPAANTSGAAGEAFFQDMGYVTVNSTTVTITLTNYANGPVVAGTVWMQQIIGNAGADDNFHVAASSPTIDAGNPASSVGQEPQPNGGRIDQGAYGGTAQTTASPQQELQVLTPVGLNSFQQGQQTTLTWRTGGLYSPTGYYASAVLATTPLAYYPLNETTGTTAADDSGNSLAATYVGGVTLGVAGALPFDPGTAVTLDGNTGYVQLPKLTTDFATGFSAEVWADPTSVGNYQAFFDFGNGSYSDNITLFRVGTTNTLGFEVLDGGSVGNVIMAANAITLDTWQYFAVTMNTLGNVTLYKNGVVIATGTTDVPRMGIVRSDNYFGKSNFGNAYYAGGLQDAAIFNVALTSAQIQATYAQSIYGTVNINLLQNGTMVQNIATGVPDSYSYTWTIPANLPVGGGYEIQVTANNGSDPSGTSAQPFQIAASGNDYYVAVNGSDSNTGTDPADPMASLPALLAAYPTIGSGDTVFVGPGTYTLVGTVLLGAAHSGLTITGPTFGVPAIFNRNNAGSDVIDVDGAANLTLEYLMVTGGTTGISLLDNTNSNGVTVNDCTAFGNNSTGIYIGANDSSALITGNTVYGLPHNSISTDHQANGIVLSGSNTGLLDSATISANIVHDCTSYGIDGYLFDTSLILADNQIYACGTGIDIAANTSGPAYLVTISGNTVFSNSAGIVASSNVMVSQNVVYGQSGTGISTESIYEVLANNVHDNAEGIFAGSSNGPVEDNVVYNNSGDGIEGAQYCPIIGNTVYGNGTGIAVDYSSTGAVSGNLVYENINQGILVRDGGSPAIANNTVYQPLGDALDILTNCVNVTLTNNILWAQTGYDINVDATSQIGFQSDYNDLYVTGAGKLVSWQGQSILTLPAWYYLVGQDQHSLSVNPQFVNPAGLDGILGYSSTTVGSPQVVSPSSASGFSTTGAWTTLATGGEFGDYLTAAAGSGASVATWTFSNLTPGATYQVAVTWPSSASWSQYAGYTVLDGSRVIGDVGLNQDNNASPPNFIYSNAGWRTLGNFAVSGTTLVVQLTNNTNGIVAADSAYIQQIQGNGGADDNFLVASGSPTIDAGNPASSVGLEPAPNGNRINLGNFGGTAQATASPQQELQVLSPAPYSKLQQGQQVNLTWQTTGLFAPTNYYAGTILNDQPLAFYRLNETSGTTATDASGNGLTATYVGGVTLGVNGALPFDPATAITLDGSTGYVQIPKISNDFTSGFSAEVWAYPTSLASNQEFFDLGNGANSDNIVLYRLGTTNSLAFVVYQGGSEGTVVTAPNAITLNTWQYFAVTMTAQGNVTLYKNGVAIATGTTDVPRKGMVRTDNYLGKSNFGNAYYAGGLDEAAIYALPLTAAQIQAHYVQAVFGTVNISLVLNNTVVESIATGVPDNFNYTWTIPANLALGAGYQVQVTANDGAQPGGSSAGSFMVVNNGDIFYINGSSTTGDVYTTAPGNDANSGKDPGHPMATLAALLQAYTLGAGDTIYVDTGNYTMLRNVVLGSQFSGITIVGPATGPGAIFNRANTNPGSYDIQMTGATNVSLAYLTLTGGLDGLFGSSTANSTSLTVANCTIFGNVSYGIFLDTGNDYANLTGNVLYGDLASNGAKQANGIYLNSGFDTITDNTVYDHTGDGIYDDAQGEGGTTISGNLVYGNSVGIDMGQSTASTALRSTVSNNIVRNNTSYGIYIFADVLVTGNTVYGQSASGAIGIGTGYAYTGGEVANNVLYANYVGIESDYTGVTILDNRLYDNSYVAIYVEGSLPVTGNIVYSNNIGVLVGYNYSGQVHDNLIYANTTDGILVEDSEGSGELLVNNTLYQVSGDAVRLDSSSVNVELRNNIIWVLAGYDIYVADNSRTGFNSDYNDLYLGTGASANIGFWNSAVNNGVQNQSEQLAGGHRPGCPFHQRQPRFRQHGRCQQRARLRPGQWRLCRLRRGRQFLPVGRLPGHRSRRFLVGAEH